MSTRRCVSGKAFTPRSSRRTCRATTGDPSSCCTSSRPFFDHSSLFTGRGLRPIEWNEAQPLRDQVSHHEIASRLGDSDIRFRKAGGDESVLQLFSVRQYPRYFRLAGMNTLIGDPYQLALSMPCPFLITMGAVALDYESARARRR
jgi:conjugal transfer ATP-binding protein TraC